MSDLFTSHSNCQKYSVHVCKLKLYVSGEYKFLHHKFSDGNTIQNSLFFLNKKIERSEIAGLKIFCSNSQVSIILISYILLKCLPNKIIQLILYECETFYLQCQSKGSITR